MLSPDLINSHYQVNDIGTKHLLVCCGIVFRDAAQLSLIIGIVRKSAAFCSIKYYVLDYQAFS